MKTLSKYNIIINYIKQSLNGGYNIYYANNSYNIGRLSVNEDNIYFNKRLVEGLLIEERQKILNLLTKEKP